MDHFDYQKLSQSESKVREISKPVKIAQLFPKQLQTGLKDLAVKISQPERITPYGKNTSTKKKNDSAVKISQPERITPYVKKKSTQKKSGANMINRFHHSEKNVRRNLKFTETPHTTRKTKHFVRTSTSNLHNKSTASERSLQTHRRSFILPPNSIRNMHVAQNSSKQSKSMFPHLNQVRILTEKSISKYPRISEVSENSPFIEDADVLVNNPVVQEKNNTTSVIQHTSLQTFKTNDRPVTSILYSSNSHSNANNAVKKANHKHSNIDEALNVNICSKQNSDGDVTIDKPQVLSTHNNSKDAKKNVNLHNGRYLNLETNAVYTPGVEKITIEDMRVPLQAIKKMSESCVDLQRGIDDDCEYVTLSKKELAILTSNLESHMNIMCRLEENISQLKLTSINVINLLSTKTASKVTNEIEIKKQMTGNFTDNAEVINNASTILSSNVQIIATEVDDSKGTSTTLDSDALTCAETNVPEATEDRVETQPSRQIDFTPVADNKENEKGISLSAKRSKPSCETRRRSARLMAKALKNSNADNDSFVNLEHELNIASKEPATPIMSRMDNTPLMSGRKDKKTGKPWKEYMAMKSRMSCLLTPNIKRFDSTESNNNMCPETSSTRSLSSKILADLQNLYSDSPDLQ
ncbi:uncharacterized protein LOC116841374 isoform X2 [Odontomachus brunneus]|nr:uncharacterized protein LOC116841374 isoform X2 [Odontomachus brunneus]